MPVRVGEIEQAPARAAFPPAARGAAARHRAGRRTAAASRAQRAAASSAWPGREREIERPAGSAGQHDQALCGLLERRELDVRPARPTACRGRRARSAASGCGSRPRAPRAGRGAAASAHGRDGAAPPGRRNRPLSAQPTIGWMPRPAQLVGEFERAEHVVGVGQARAPAGGRPWRARRACRWSARLRAANRTSAHAGARSRGRTRGFLVIPSGRRSCGRAAGRVHSLRREVPHTPTFPDGRHVQRPSHGAHGDVAIALAKSAAFRDAAETARHTPS